MIVLGVIYCFSGKNKKITRVPHLATNVSIHCHYIQLVGDCSKQTSTQTLSCTKPV